MATYKQFKNRRFSREERSNDVVFECTRLKGSDKRGVLTPDSDGCYTMVIGALNSYNSAGDFYTLEAGRKFFNESSSFQRRINRGVLKAEYGHPKKETGMTDREYASRIMRLEETRICGTWRKIWLSNDVFKDEAGRSVVAIMGTIFPSGYYGQALERDLKSPGQNVCFSIRSFTIDKPRGDGSYLKDLEEIVTFDYVTEPGIWNAEKLLSPNLECFNEVRYSAEELHEVISDISTNSLRYGLESGNNYSDFKEKLGVIKEKKLSSKRRAAFTKW